MDYCNNCFYSVTGPNLNCTEHYTPPPAPKIASVRIEDTFSDGIPFNLLSEKHRFAFAVTNENNKFAVNQCYKINGVKIRVLRIDKRIHYQKDIIHFSLPEIEAKFKSYANAEFEIIQC